MKIVIQKEQLHNAIQKTERVTGKNLSLPVLKCVLLSTEKNKLIVRATNLDLGIEVSVPAEVLKEGVVAVPADTISSLLSTLTFDGPVELELQDNFLVVITPKSKTKVATVSHEDFPSLPKISENELFLISSKNFADALRSVWWSASVGSIKPELSSVYMYPDGEHLVSVATDSFRLAEKKVTLEKALGLDTLLIPLKNIAEILRHLEESQEDVMVMGDAHQIGFTLKNTYITSRAVEGIFPDYKQIIPKEFETEATLLKQDLVDALKHVRLFSDQFNKLLVKVSRGDKKFSVQTTNLETGESSMDLDVAVEGPDIEMNFNYTYILDGLQAIGTDSVSLQFAGVGKPTLLRSVGDKSFTYIVMPMNR